MMQHESPMFNFGYRQQAPLNLITAKTFHNASLSGTPTSLSVPQNSLAKDQDYVRRAVRWYPPLESFI